MPPEKVEVAIDVLRMEPPEILNPLEEFKPAVVIPPLNVLVPLLPTIVVVPVEPIVICESAERLVVEALVAVISGVVIEEVAKKEPVVSTPAKVEEPYPITPAFKSKVVDVAA